MNLPSKDAIRTYIIEYRKMRGLEESAHRLFSKICRDNELCSIIPENYQIAIDGLVDCLIDESKIDYFYEAIEDVIPVEMIMEKLYEED